MVHFGLECTMVNLQVIQNYCKFWLRLTRRKVSSKTFNSYAHRRDVQPSNPVYGDNVVTVEELAQQTKIGKLTLSADFINTQSSRASAPRRAFPMPVFPAGSNLEWRVDASCLGSDPDIFLPLGRVSVASIEQAKAICNTCLPQAECLEFAIVNNEPAGIWGGKTTVERRQIRSARLRRNPQSKV